MKTTWNMKAQMFNFSGWINETDPKVLNQIFTKALEVSGFKILTRVEHHFKPYGYTSLYLLAESHLAIHTFPEVGKSYIELSSCVEPQYRAFIKYCQGWWQGKTNIT